MIFMKKKQIANNSVQHSTPARVQASKPYLQAKSGCSCGGGCPSCIDKTDNSEIFNNPLSMREHRTNGLPQLSSSPPVQRKVTLGSADSTYEREADDIANDIVSGANTTAARRVTPIGNADIQPVANESGVAEAAAAVQSGGRALTEGERSYFEPRFGYDFSEVRIHENERAAKASDSIGAMAYTLGNNIAFSSGVYNANSTSSRTLMAHELTHTLQQTGGTSIQRESWPDIDELWERTTRFGERQVDRAERYYDRGADYVERGLDYAERGLDYAERGVDRAERELTEAGEGIEEWWDRGSGAITRIDFNGTNVTVSGTSGGVYPAVSGLMPHHRLAGGVDYTQPEHQNVPSKGPIPEGEYYLDPAEVESNPPGRFNTRAWGHFRTRLHETTTTAIDRHVTSERTGGFYLHQDPDANGTAGCIGFRNGSHNRSVHALISANKVQIPVHVAYPTPTPESTTSEDTVQASRHQSQTVQAQRTDNVIQRQQAPTRHRLIDEGIAKIDRDALRYGSGNFPADYYDRLARHLYRFELHRNGRSYANAFSTLDSLQWGTHGSALRRHYEQVVGTDSANGWDKFRHFVFTAYLQYFSGGFIAPEAFTYGKELFDEAEHQVGLDPEGYSVPDVRADNRGEAFAEEMSTQENDEFVDSLWDAASDGLTALTDPRTWGVIY